MTVIYSLAFCENKTNKSIRYCIILEFLPNILHNAEVSVVTKC